MSGGCWGRGTERSRGVLKEWEESEGFRVMVQVGFLGEAGVQVENVWHPWEMVAPHHRPRVLRPHLRLSSGQV